MTYILCFTDEAKKDLAGIKKNEPAVETIGKPKELQKWIKEKL
jgi:hypothetical protein